MVKIRLMRIGAKKRPFYRVVAVDERKKRTGAYLELLGTYNPLTEPKQINLRQDLIDAWLKKGAVPSDGFLRIIGKAPQRPPRKAKKVKPEVVEKVVVETPVSDIETENAPQAEEVLAAESTEQVETTAEAPAEEVAAEVAPEPLSEPETEEQPETETKI